MKYNPDIHHRRSIRLAGYDYSQCGYYFITVFANTNNETMEFRAYIAAEDTILEVDETITFAANNT